MKLKSFRTNAALILTLMLVAVAATVATAQTYTDLYNFDGPHGAAPSNPGILAQGRDGNLYSTTPQGGAYGIGVAFKVTTGGALKDLYIFDTVHGSNPSSGLTLGTDGNFYGTAWEGGANNAGTMFKITRNGSLTTQYSFTGPGIDGNNPLAPPILGADGNFYGTTQWTAYRFTHSGVFTLLSPLSDGGAAPLIQGTDGNFYGTTTYGGSSTACDAGCGTIFKVTPKGSVTILHEFDFAQGEFPLAPLTQGSDGNFYGTTWVGGTNDSGVVYKLTEQGTFTVLHNFGDSNYAPDAVYSSAGLVAANDGYLYGVTLAGRAFNCGAIFKITPAGLYSILYDFDCSHGAVAVTTPMQHTNGKIYGMTYVGGTSGVGVIYGFDFGAAPFVSLVTNLGKVGRTIEILGQGFTGTTEVSFNGTPATYTVLSDTFLGATVPEGATTGFVTVTTAGGTLTSNKTFRVKP